MDPVPLPRCSLGDEQFRLPPPYQNATSPCFSPTLPAAERRHPLLNAQSSTAVAQPHEPVGPLHLTSCTYDEYLRHTLDEEYLYDLVDDILISNPIMGSREHEGCINKLMRKVKEDSSRGKHSYWPFPNARIEIPASNVLKRLLGKRTTRRADLLVLRSDAYSRSPSRTRTRATDTTVLVRLKDRKPKLVLEVTSRSSSRHADLNDKVKEYQRRRIDTYVIVDRATSSPSVIVYRRLNSRRSRYTKRVYRGSQRVRCPIFDNMTAEDMLTPLEEDAEKRDLSQRFETERKLVHENRRQSEEIRRKSEEIRRKSEEIERLRAENQRLKGDSESHETRRTRRRSPSATEKNVRSDSARAKNKRGRTRQQHR